MAVIKKKTTPHYFKLVLSGKKNFDVRLADWKCKPGDILVLEEYEPKEKRYTGRRIRKKVNYVLKTKKLKFFDKKAVEKHGYQIIGLDY